MLWNLGEVGPKCSENKGDANKFREADREVSQGQGQRKSSIGFHRPCKEQARVREEEDQYLQWTTPQTWDVFGEKTGLPLKQPSLDVLLPFSVFAVSGREWTQSLVSQAGALPLGNTPVLTTFLLLSDLRSRLLLPIPPLRHLQVCDLKRLSSWALRTGLRDGL